jgi:SNF2 family DNA or RNA helicase
MHDRVRDSVNLWIVKSLSTYRLTESNQNKNSIRCSSCDVAVAVETRRKSVARGGTTLPPSSAKIRKIIDLLVDILDRDVPEGEALEKAIIFSQFTSFRMSLFFLRKSESKPCSGPSRTVSSR